MEGCDEMVGKANGRGEWDTYDYDLGKEAKNTKLKTRQQGEKKAKEENLKLRVGGGKCNGHGTR